MKGIADPYAYGLSEVEGDRKTLLLTFFVSTICHLLLFAVLIFYPNRAWDRKPPLSFINVSIVTLPTFEKGPQPVARPSIQPKRQPPTQNKQPPSKTTYKAISAAAKTWIRRFYSCSKRLKSMQVLSLNIVQGLEPKATTK